MSANAFRKNDANTSAGLLLGKGLVLCLVSFTAVSLAGCRGGGPTQSVPTLRPPSRTRAIPTPIDTPGLPRASVEVSEVTSTPRSTPTRLPSVAPSQETAFWLRAVRTNLGCKLPCWWGMEPGVATWTEVSNLFTTVGGKPFMSPPSQSLKRYDLYIHSSTRDPQPIAFALWEREAVIRGFEVAAGPLHPVSSGASDFQEVASAFEGYSMQSLLAILGEPTAVFLDAQSAPAEEGAPWTYGIWLHWGDQAVAAFYEGVGLRHRGKTTVLCPDYSTVTSLRLYIWSVDEGLTLSQMTSATADISAQIAEGKLLSIQDAAGMGPSEFWRLFSSSQEGICIDLK